MTVKKTFPKILGLIVSSSIFFIILFSALFYYTQKTENDVYEDSVKQYESKISKLIDLESKPILVAINNHTNGDEFVDCVAKKDSAWYRETIDNKLEIYDADYLGAYNIFKNLVIRTPTPKIRTADFIPKQAMYLLEKGGVKKFYLNIPEGIVEVTGASIHPSNDPKKNKTKSLGYFFVVRLLDWSGRRNLEKVTNSYIRLVDKNSTPLKEDGKIVTMYELKDYEGKTIGKLQFERPFDVYFENITEFLYVIIIVFFVFLLINLIYARELIYYPLNLVRSVLETGDKESINQLKNTSGEFRYIGDLFEENYYQSQELVKSRKKAEESERLKTAFLENLCHEIRTPMNAINGFTELMINTELSDGEKKEYLSIIDKSGKNLVSIIDDLIEMSKIESNQITPNFSSVNLDICLKELYKAIKITIPKSKDIDFKLIPSKNPVRNNIITDETKLKQIITNLITNAVKFTDMGEVTVGYDADDYKGVINFSVTDTGLGIDEVEHKKIFDRFKRVKSDTAIKVGGLGLGLAITKAYVELFGGAISLESEIGKGSVFYFSIPLQYDTNQERIQKIKPVNTVSTMTQDKCVILIAEDDNINFLLFQKMIQNKNYEIIRAMTGQEAVDACAGNPNIDIVMMDIKMPVMDGFEAIAEIRPLRPELPIIAQTAYSTLEDKERIEAAGFTDYITKPLNREKIFDLIAKYTPVKI